MILMDVKIWNEVKKEFEVFEALVDTGSTYCVIEKSIAEDLGLPTLEVLHLWQMGESLNVPKTKLRVRYNEEEYGIEGLIVEVKASYKRPILKGEECTRPESPHPLANRIVIGKTLLDKLPEEGYRELFKRVE
jgi:predicted aspartyl protease